jgi:hypothetical protein
MTEKQRAARLKWLHENSPSSCTLEDLSLLIGDAVSRFTPDEKAHLRAQLYRRYGLKNSGGKPS